MSQYIDDIRSSCDSNLIHVPVSSSREVAEVPDEQHTYPNELSGPNSPEVVERRDHHMERNFGAKPKAPKRGSGMTTSKLQQNPIDDGCGLSCETQLGQDLSGSTTIDVLDAFIDVSALVREKSRFSQYTNHCYTMDKNSKRLVIELNPKSVTNAN